MNAIIVQARMGSTRLKNKMLLPLAGKPIIYRIVERLKRVKKAKKIILAIPNKKENNEIKNIFKNDDVIIFQGSENNLVERYYLAAKNIKLKIL